MFTHEPGRSYFLIYTIHTHICSCEAGGQKGWGAVLPWSGPFTIPLRCIIPVSLRVTSSSFFGVNFLRRTIGLVRTSEIYLIYHGLWTPA